jgi:hypothetical protein
MKKTAGTIGISVCAAKSRLFHAKTALRKSLRTKYAGVRAERGTVLRFVRASRYSSTGVRTNSPMALRRKVG